MTSKVSNKALSIANAARESARFEREARDIGESLQSLVDRASEKQLLDAARDLMREYAGLREVFHRDTDVLPHKTRRLKDGSYETVTDAQGNPQPVTASQFPAFMVLARTVRRSSKWDGKSLRIKSGVVSLDDRAKPRGGSQDGDSQQGSNSDTTSRRKGKDSRAAIVGNTVQRMQAITKGCEDATARRRIADMVVEIAVECGVSTEGIRNAINRHNAAQRRKEAEKGETETENA